MNIMLILSVIKNFGSLIFEYWRFWVPAVFVAIGAYFGHSHTEKSWEAKFSKLEKEAAELREQNLVIQAKSEQITVVEVTKYVDRVRVVKERAEEIIREVPIYVTQEADAACTIPDGFVWLHNAAATNNPVEVPDAARSVNENTTGVELSTVAETVAQNYGTYHEVVEQLKALQSWIREQEKLHNE